MINRCFNAEKAIAAYAIVFIHCLFPSYLGVIVDCIARFGVPLFFMISGYFCYYNEENCFSVKVKNKLLHIGILIIISQVLAFLLQIILHINNLMNWLVTILNIKVLVRMLLFNQSPFLESTWFLFALFYSYLLIGIVLRFKLLKVAYLAAPVLLIVQLILGELLSSTGNILPSYITRNFLTMGFPFLMIGYLIHKYESRIYRIITNKQIICLTIATCFIVIVERCLTARNDLYISSIFTAGLLCIYAIKNKEVKINKRVEIIGRKYSLGIYILHPMLLQIILRLESRHGIDNMIYFYIRPVFLCIISTLITMLVISAKAKASYFIKQSKQKVESAT